MISAMRNLMTRDMKMNLKERYRRFRAWQENPFDYTNHCDHTVRCANCGTEFSDNFCPRCGQKANTGHINWRTVWQGVLILWGMDNRSLSFTLVQLVLRPGYLVRDYLSGKRQVSFPPVKMLFILAIVNMLATRLHDKLYGSVAKTETIEGAYAYLNTFFTWAEENTAWSALLFTALFIPPTWLFFRWAPRFPRHNLPEGFFLQVFMGSLSLLTDTVVQLTGSWANILVAVGYIVTYKQLFGYGWWGTLWRLFFCFAIGFGLMLIAFIAAAVWFNLDTIIQSK